MALTLHRWWEDNWRSLVIVAVIIAAMAWALKPKSRPTVEMPPFEQTEKKASGEKAEN